MLNDQPAQKDLLGRRPFAASIARVITRQTDPAPQVIAIHGAWGEGKTTVFGFLRQELEDNRHNVFEFNPWRYPDEESMIRGFATGLAARLGVKILSKHEQWIETAYDHSEWVKEAIGAAGAERVGGLFHVGAKRLRLTLEQLMDRVKAELNCHGRRVTVLVDDPDRLEVVQLIALFRLIKLIADFEWLTFVLAMDCDAVARTVGERFGGDVEGRRFLEKLIQVPIRMPSIPHAKLKEYVLQLLQAVVSDMGVDIAQDEVNRFRGAFDPVFMPLIGTPRVAKRYANVVRFALGLLPGEVNPVDVMLLEALRTFNNELFRRLQENLIPPIDPHWLDEVMEKHEEQVSKLMSKLLPEGDSDNDRMTSVLIMLFPSKLSRATFDEEEFLSWTRAKRVACDEYFIRYLAATVPDNDVPDAEIDVWLGHAQSGSIDELASSIRSSLTPKTELILAQKLRRCEHQLNDIQRKTFAIATARISDHFSWKEVAWQFQSPFGQSAIFAGQCISNMIADDNREDLAAEVLNSASSTLWAAQLFRYLPHESEKDDSRSDDKGPRFSQEATQRLGTILADRFIREIEGGTRRHSVPFLKTAFNFCAKYGETARIQLWSRQQLTHDPQFINEFAELVMDWVYSGDLRQLEWPGNERLAKLVEDYVGSDWLLNNISPPPPPTRSRWSHTLHKN